jgi:O-antigen/teichoic acid export membrane protein
LGTFFLFQALSTVLTDVADFGVGTAVEKRISEGQRSSAVLTTAIVLRVVALTVIVLGIVLLRNRINGYLGADFALYLAAAIAIATGGNLLLAVLRGQLRVEATAIMPLLNQVLWISSSLWLLTVGFGVEALVYGFIAGQLAVLLWGAYRVGVIDRISDL